MCRFLRQRFRSLVAFWHIESTWLLKETLLSRMTPRYLSEVISSRGENFWLGGVVVSTSVAAMRT